MSSTHDANRRRPHRSEVRSRLIAAARDVFTDRGFAAASVDEVARRAGLTKGAVYSNFESKEQLFTELLAQEVAKRIGIVEAWSAPLDPKADSPQRVGDQLMHAVDDSADWHILFAEFWLWAMRNPKARDGFVAQRRRLHELVTHAVRQRADELGLRLRIPAEQLATLGLALSNGLAFEHHLDPSAVPSELFGRVLAALIET